MTISNKRQKREEYRKTHREDGGSKELPKKRFYRQRAHANPFSDHQLTYPVSPSQMDWSPYFPAFVDQTAANNLEEDQPRPLTKPVTVADIGCGFGGLLVALAPMLPKELILGLEIRTQVTEYVQDRISALRAQHAPSDVNRKVVLPSFVVRDDVYAPLRASPSAKPTEPIEEYIITSHKDVQEEELDELDSKIKEIAGAYPPLSFPTPHGAKSWITNLTENQTTAIRNLPNINSITPNHLPSTSPQQSLTPTYYHPTTHTLTPTAPPPPYANISVLRANTMKFLPNFFTRHQLRTIFLCFPDPHFKARKHKARIVSSTLCAEYAYVLRPGGCIYTITDVEELARWMRERFREFGGGEVFEKVEVPGEGREGDAEWVGGDGEGDGGRGEVARLVRCIREETEEGKKVSRNKGCKFVSVWRRREDPKWPDEVDEG